MKILICLACHNRKAVTRFAIETLAASKGPDDGLVAYNDASVEYDDAYLYSCGAERVVTTEKIWGIERQRVQHLRDFLATTATHVYFTDNDTIHDPTWRANAERLLDLHLNPPLCLYNTRAHANLAGNTLHDIKGLDVIWRRVAPGVSYLLNREHVESLKLEALTAFDWQIPEQLGGRFAVSRTSYLDHIGYGGIRHPPEEGLGGGDRALNPTPWLVEKRKEVVTALHAAGLPL